MGANGQQLFSQDNTGLQIFTYPTVGRSLLFGSTSGPDQSTTSTASALINLNGTIGNVSIRSFGPGNLSGKSVLILDQYETSGAGGTPDIFTASASGVKKMKLTSGGDLYAEKYYDVGSTAGFFIDVAGGTDAIVIDGNIRSSGAFTISSNDVSDAATNGNITINAGTGDIILGGADGAAEEVCISLDGVTCTGKINAGTVDPPYTIDGKNYATYLPSMTGVKEETVGTVSTSTYVSGIGYRAVIDFTSVPESSDLWVFSRVTDLKKNNDQLVVLLSPNTPVKTWYNFDEKTLTLSLYSSRPTKISYRLTAPRYDWQQWANIRDPNERKGMIVDYQSDWWTGSGNGQTPEDPLLNLVIEPLTPPVSGQLFRIRDTQTNNRIEETIALSRGLIATLQTGLFTALEGTINSLRAQSIISPIAQIDDLSVNTISPIGNSESVNIKLSQTETFGILNDTNKRVTSFDAEGNATFDGTVKSEELVVKNNASISGELFAGSVNTTDITTDDATISGTLHAESIIGTFGDLSEKLRSLDNAVASVSSAPTQIIIESSESAALANAVSVTNGDLVVNTNLFVLAETSLSQTSITGSLLVDGMIHFTQNIIETIGETLYIQKNKLANVDILDGTLLMDIYNRIFVTGDLFVSGNTTVNGVLGVSTIKPTTNGLTIDLSSPLPLLEASGSASPSARFSSLLIRGADQTIVASIDASGSARFGGNVSAQTLNVVEDIHASGSATVKKLNISLSDPYTATPSAIPSDTIGTGILPANYSEITILSSETRANSLIYLTPLSSTGNQVLFIKQKLPGVGFIVGMDQPYTLAAQFNWWIIN